MKKFFKIILWGLAGLVALIALSVVILSLTGIPQPSNFTVRNIERPGIGHIPQLVKLLSTMSTRYALIRTDEQGNVIFLKNEQALLLEAASGNILPFEGAIPHTGLLGQVQYSKGKYYYLQEVSAQENHILLAMDEQSGAVDTLLVRHKGFYDFKIAPDGSSLYAIEEDNLTGKFFLYSLPLDKPEDFVTLYTPHELVSIQTIDPAQQELTLVEIYRQDRFLKFNTQKRTLEPLFPEEDSLKYSTGYTSHVLHNRLINTKDAQTLYFARTTQEGLGKEFTVLLERREDSVRQVSPNVPGEVGHMELTPDETFVVYTLTNGGFSSLYAYNREDQTVKEVFKGEEFNLDWFNSTPFLITQENKVLFSTGSYYGARLMSADLATGEVNILDESQDEALKNQLSFHKISFPTPDEKIGLLKEIPAYLYKPTQTAYEKMPVVIELHGGPEMPSFPYVFSMAPYWMEKGIAVITPDYRGSAGYGISFEKADDGIKRIKQIEDVKSLHDWIKTQPDLDANRVILMGGSHGGYMVMAALAQYPDDFLGGLSFSGISDYSLVMYDKISRTRWWKDEFGDFDDPKQRWLIDSISPYTYADRIKKPLMLIHGTEDPRVVYQNSDKMAEAIAAAGGKVRYLEAAGYGHALQPEGPLEGLYMISATFDFIDDLLADEKAQNAGY